MMSQVHNIHFAIINFVRIGKRYLDNLENLEPSLSDEMKMAPMYIARYITRNDNQPWEYETHSYYEKYGKYTNSIDL